MPVRRSWVVSVMTFSFVVVRASSVATGAARHPVRDL
jgi:hypothetical protein